MAGSRPPEPTEPPDPRSPSGTSGVSDREPDRVGQLFDLVTYAIVTTVVFAAIATVLGRAFGWPAAPSVKYGLFVFGWLALGYGTLLLRPSAAWRDDDGGFNLFDRSADKPDTKFQRLVQAVPPARFRQIPDDIRLSTGARIFVAALVMLGTSLVLEQVFGVGP